MAQEFESIGSPTASLLDSIITALGALSADINLILGTPEVDVTGLQTQLKALNQAELRRDELLAAMLLEIRKLVLMTQDETGTVFHDGDVTLEEVL